MTLTATEYRMADVRVPDSVFQWSLDLSSSALLIHDMQRYFLRAYRDLTGPLNTLVPNVQALRDLAHRVGMPVYYTAQPGAMTSQERGLLYDVWGSGMSADEADRGILPAVAPGPDDVILTKWRYSAFFRSDLLERLHDAGRGQLVVCGVYAGVGIQATLVDAFSRDIEPFLVADAIADFDGMAHQQALDYAAKTCARIARTHEVFTAERADE